MMAVEAHPHIHTVAKPRRDARPWLVLLSLLVIALDRWSKVEVANHLSLGQAHTVIPGVFRITHVLNTGAAFSMFAESATPLAVRVGLVLFSVVAIGVVGFLLWKYGRLLSPASLGFALVMGGAVGNLYDRVRFHYVVDFLEVRIVHYHWPDFNVADSAITVGAVLLMVEMLWPRTGAHTPEDDVPPGDLLAR